MKSFSNFIKESDVPTNVTGATVSTDVPVITKKISNKYKSTNIILARRIKPNDTGKINKE